MSFILRMAWRDSRRSRRRLVLFSLSVVLGIAALVAIGSFADNLRRGIEAQAKTLLGADLAIGSRQPLSAEVDAYLNRLGGERARDVVLATMAVFPASGEQTRLVSLRGLAGGYPFYGDASSVPESAYRDVLRPGSDGAVVEETLLAQFGAKVGDPIKLGQQTFRIVGALKKLPGDSAAVAMLSPRVIIALDRLDGTGLIGPGSLVRYRTYFRFPESVQVEPLVTELKERFASLRLGFDTVDHRKQELGQALTNVYAFLSLVGFISLFLGGIGVASAVAVHVRQKLATVAILRCLGASASQSFSVYLAQGVGLGVIGAVLGALLGIGAQLIVPALVKDFLPFDVAFFVSWPAVVRGMGAGLAICIVFTLLPLLAIRTVSPLLALRSVVPVQRGRDPWRLALYGLVAAAVVGFAVWQTGRWSIGVGFAGALGATFLVLAALARTVAWLTRRFLPARLPYVWRQGISNLYRPNNRTVLLLVSLGLGTFLILTLALARATLLEQIRGRGAGDRPNLLFFDIQDDQIVPLGELMSAQGAPLKAQAPIVTMRLKSWKGRPVEEVMKDPQLRIPAWSLRREYRSTYRDRLTDTEKLVSGAFTGRLTEPTDPIPVSIEDGLAKEMQLKLGDELVWDIQGVPLATRITSMRSVDWQRLQPNFFFVFPAGVLEMAPKSFIAATRAASSAESARLQQQVVQRFPNVSAIDLALVLQTLDGVFSKVEFVVRFLALLTVATGVIVLVGAVLTGRFQRIRESVLLRTLGASRQQLRQIQLAEYAVLGALAALTGGGLAFGGNALLATFVFHVPVVAPLGLLAWAVVGVTGLTLLAGSIAGRGVANQPPLEVLRQEV
ncbi:ABC transporter permease [Opitutaceae bacterium EW11]|nr:ABC transporter permease [Opitutaceae bacterium EW11]